MATIKQLSSFMALNVNGGDRISYTYDVLDADSGDVVEANVKESFFVTESELRAEVEAVRDYIREHKLA